jgi:hypothetical protein
MADNTVLSIPDHPEESDREQSESTHSVHVGDAAVLEAIRRNDVGTLMEMRARSRSLDLSVYMDKESRRTPLMEATRTENIEVVKWLVEEVRVDVNRSGG